MILLYTNSALNALPVSSPLYTYTRFSEKNENAVKIRIRFMLYPTKVEKGIFSAQET